MNHAKTTRTRELLDAARNKLYEIAGGARDSDDVTAASITIEQRLEYWRSKEFLAWAAAAREDGDELFYLKDVDMTQGMGDVFIWFFLWRAQNKMFLPVQLRRIAWHLLWRQGIFMGLLIAVMQLLCAIANGIAWLFGKSVPVPSFAALTPERVVQLWQMHEDGGKGIDVLEFWSKIYWPSQIGMTETQKLAQVSSFAPLYAERVYPGVTDENRVLLAAGIHVVIVSNGDHELAVAIAKILGIPEENVVGSRLVYGADERATSVVRSYELFTEPWSKRPQPGKILAFHLWMRRNMHRFGWTHIDEERIVIVARDGDSASADGGMMIFYGAVAIANFMVDTPNHPKRIQAFLEMVARYGFTLGQFIRLIPRPAKAEAKAA